MCKQRIPISIHIPNANSIELLFHIQIALFTFQLNAACKFYKYTKECLPSSSSYHHSSVRNPKIEKCVHNDFFSVSFSLFKTIDSFGLKWIRAKCGSSFHNRLKLFLLFKRCAFCRVVNSCKSYFVQIIITKPRT